MVTVGDEGTVGGRQQDEVLLPRNHAVEVLIVVFVHYTHTHTHVLHTHPLTGGVLCSGLTGSYSSRLSEPKVHGIR